MQTHRSLQGLLFTIVAALFFGLCGTVAAGGGPENVLLVVNKRSWASRTVANHYISLRNIPSNNVFFLDWIGSVERTNIAAFRKQILQPILAEIDKRRLGEQIDYVVYSADFPYEIDFSSELTRKGSFMSASLTSLTYLYEFVMGNQTNNLGGSNNWYANLGVQPGSTVGFDNNHAWSGMSRKSTDEKGNNYLLSAMLGYTSGRGNSIEEVVNYLRRSAAADGLHPDGTVYLMQNDDIRSKTRSVLFTDVARAIKANGGKAEIVQGVIPSNKPDVIGITLGKHIYRWQQSKSEFLPGAICDNLTSFGGVLRDGAGQTPLTEALRYGAAGATGTVIEPYAIRSKFPHPVMHLHYRRGCSLAEAVYLSVPSPYQLLLVGDPLCQPYAMIPQVNVQGIPSEGKLSGEVEIMPSVVANLVAADPLRFELYIDGIRRAACRKNGKLQFDSATMPDGVHEIRIVVIMNNAVRTQGRKTMMVQVANRENTIKTRLASPKQISLNGQIAVDIEAPNASRGLVMFSQRELVASAQTKRATISFSPLRIGMGPHRLMAVGLGKSNLENVFAAPVDVEVTAGHLFPGSPLPVGLHRQNGVEVTLPDGTRTSVAATAGLKWLEALGVKRDMPFSINGFFSVPANGIYQFQMRFSGDLHLKVDGKTIFKQNDTKPFTRFEVPINLARGEHRLHIDAKVNPPRMILKFGGQGTQALAGPTFMH